MKKQQNNEASELKPDLKHDSMEYAASTEGDDILDMDDSTLEDNGITADELDIIETGDEYEQTQALNSVETDRLADEDNFLDSTGEDNELAAFDEADEDDEHENERNN